MRLKFAHRVEILAGLGNRKLRVRRFYNCIPCIESVNLIMAYFLHQQCFMIKFTTECLWNLYQLECDDVQLTKMNPCLSPLITRYIWRLFGFSVVWSPELRSSDTIFEMAQRELDDLRVCSMFDYHFRKSWGRCTNIWFSLQTKIHSFRVSDLQTLISTVGRSRNGKKQELQNRALEILRTQPSDVNINAFKLKIHELYRLAQ